MPSCEGAWTTKEPSLDIKEKIFYRSSLEEADLSNLYLIGVDLQGRNLQKANLFGADLQNARAEGANFRGAKLELADLRGARLQGANFTGANLVLADLRRAILRLANFTGANLRDTKVTFSQARYLRRQGLSGFVVVE